MWNCQKPREGVRLGWGHIDPGLAWEGGTGWPCPSSSSSLPPAASEQCWLHHSCGDWWGGPPGEGLGVGGGGRVGICLPDPRLLPPVLRAQEGILINVECPRPREGVRLTWSHTDPQGLGPAPRPAGSGVGGLSRCPLAPTLPGTQFKIWSEKLRSYKPRCMAAKKENDSEGKC